MYTLVRLHIYIVLLDDAILDKYNGRSIFTLTLLFVRRYDGFVLVHEV